MTLGEAVTPATTPPPSDLGEVETDLFCPACHYNLYGLPIHRDDRLDLPIVRCPECGKFVHPGHASGAGRLWLHRLARMLIAAWTLFILTVIAACGFAFFILDMINFDAFTHYPRSAFAGGVWIREPITPADFSSFNAYLVAHTVFAAACLAVGWLLSAFLATFVFHIKRFNHLWTLGMAVAVGAICLYLWSEGPGSRGPHSWVFWDWPLFFAFRALFFQSVGILLGLVTGRPVVRFLLRGILTKRLLRYTTFLWEIDGRIPPGHSPPK